jgi:hypothetical protein
LLLIPTKSTFPSLADLFYPEYIKTPAAQKTAGLTLEELFFFFKILRLEFGA